mgnify:CR=1 FL=1
MELREHEDGAGRRGRHERGQTLVVATLVLVVLVGFMALVIDVGNIYTQRRRMQNAADAGALAACRSLALDRSHAEVQEVAGSYAQANGAQQWSVGIGAKTVSVAVTETFPTYFASVVGVPTFTVSAYARAHYEPPGPWTGGMMPLAVYEGALRGVGYNQKVQIWDSETVVPGDNVISDGQRGWLNFDGRNVSNTELQTWIRYGWGGEIRFPMWINGTPGTKDAALQAMDAYRKGQIIYVPIYDAMRPGQEGNGQLDYRVVAVGSFLVSDVKYRGNPKYIEGVFTYTVVPRKGGGTVDAGTRVVNLE